MGRQYMVAGNWKMHNDLGQARKLMAELRDRIEPSCPVEVVVCPPFTLLYPMGREIDKTAIKLGAQNCHFEPSGAFTGEISPTMLKAANVEYVIIGHSERRRWFGEGGDLLARKCSAVLQHQMKVIFCVGETLEQRESGDTQSVIQDQLADVLAAGTSMDRVTIAYEPVWAIGTGRTASPEQAQEVHSFIRGWVGGRFGVDAEERTRLLYGGSVKPDNAAELMGCPDVDGALVGGACLAAESFASIISAAACAPAG